MEQRAFMLPTEIGKDEICSLAGIQKQKLNRIILVREYGFPESTRLVNRGLTFDRAQVMEWMSENNMKTMRVRSLMQRAEPVQSLFNSMAVGFIIKPFISAPKTSTSFVNRHPREFGKTIVVHLYECDDYTPPHRGFDLFITGDSYRVAHEGSEW